MNIDWSQLASWQNFFNLIDVIIVWLLIYQLLKIIRNTKAINILNGVFIFLLFKIISALFQLETIDWIMNNIIRWSVVGAIIIFQPEIRRGLEHLGQRFFTAKRTTLYNNPTEKMIDELIVASNYMAKRRIGALIAIEKNQSLEDIANTGTELDADISSQLLINIFIPNTPLHDGAVVIQNLKISAAACYLPLSEDSTIPKELGTRHRAAVGLSENSDAVTLVVSEETGDISITYQGRIFRDLDEDELRTVLIEHFVTKEDDDENFFVSLLARATRGDDKDE